MQPHIQDFMDLNQSKTYQYTPVPDGEFWDQANWVLHHSGAPWLELLGIDAPYKAMYEEARALRDMFVFHRDQEDGHRGWRSLAVHGISATKTNIPETYGLDPNKITYGWTEIQDRCPETVRFFREVFPYNSYQRLRYMLLEPGGFIAPHSDNPRSSLCAAVNISLNNPAGCRMVTELGQVPFRDEGSVFLFNNHYQHAVYNNSDIDRFHIIVHGSWRDPDWSRLVLNSYKKAANG